jgi:hypothetical protein
MITARADLSEPETSARVSAESRYETWAHWPVNWTAVWVGTLTAFTIVLLLGLIGTAVGAHLLTPEHRVTDLKKLGIGTLIFSVCAAFFSFAAGGWVAGKVAGILRSEPAMLHGAIVWLVCVPLLLLAAVLGAGTNLGTWYGGLAGTPASSTAAPYARPDIPLAGATREEVAQYRDQLDQYQHKVTQWNEDTPKAARNTALGAVTALLLGLVGGVIGGWMACGEPMTFTHYRTRHAADSAHRAV